MLVDINNTPVPLHGGFATFCHFDEKTSRNRCQKRKPWRSFSIEDGANFYFKFLFKSIKILRTNLLKHI